MDYQFVRSMHGQVLAEFESELMLLGMWFTEELAINPDLFETLSDKITALESRLMHEWELAGKDINLIMDKDEVTVFRTAATADSTNPLPEGTELDPLSESAGCGLADFKQVLKSWRDFNSG